MDTTYFCGSINHLLSEATCLQDKTIESWIYWHESNKPIFFSVGKSIPQYEGVMTTRGSRLFTGCPRTTWSDKCVIED